jgi:hypothetical protein
MRSSSTARNDPPLAFSIRHAKLSPTLIGIIIFGVVVSTAWLILNVIMSLSSDASDEGLHLNTVMFMSAFSFVPQIFSLAVQTFFIILSLARPSHSMRFVAFITQVTFGACVWFIVNFGLEYSMLSDSHSSWFVFTSGSARYTACHDDEHSSWCIRLKVVSGFALTLFAVQLMLLAYSAVEFFSKYFGDKQRPAVESEQRVMLVWVILGICGFMVWAGGSAYQMTMNSIDVDFFRLLLSPFLFLIMFLSVVVGSFVVLEPNHEVIALNVLFAALGIAAFGSIIGYDIRRLHDTAVAPIGLTACDTHPSNPTLCRVETLIVVGIGVMLLAQMLMQVSLIHMGWQRRHLYRADHVFPDAEHEYGSATSDYEPMYAPVDDDFIHHRK